MSRINGEKSRAHLNSRRRAAQRVQLRQLREEFLASKRAAATPPAQPSEEAPKRRRARRSE